MEMFVGTFVHKQMCGLGRDAERMLAAADKWLKEAEEAERRQNHTLAAELLELAISAERTVQGMLYSLEQMLGCKNGIQK